MRRLVNTLSKSYIEMELGEFIERECPRIGLHDRFAYFHMAYTMFNTFEDKQSKPAEAQVMMDFVINHSKQYLKEVRGEYFTKKEAEEIKETDERAGDAEAPVPVPRAKAVGGRSRKEKAV